MEKTLDFVENKLCDILDHKVENENFIDSKLNVKESLVKILSSESLRCSFEQLLKKNYNLSNWSFWLDINKLIEEERTIEEDFKRIQELTQKYLMETSIDEVKFYFIFSKNLKSK
jgi:hypothetical protein